MPKPVLEPVPATPQMQEKASEIYRLLLELHGELERVPRREPLHELISTMLSHRTTEAQEEAAFQTMWAKFGSWQAIQNADFEDLSESLRGVQWPQPKAANIQKVLARIVERNAASEREPFSLAFLEDFPTFEALDWLISLPGVGLKTATLVLLFCLGQPVLPVDTHLHRVCGRLGLIGEKTSPEAAHAILLGMLPRDAHTLYNFHIALLRHGQKICLWKAPRCSKCPLRPLCDFYQNEVKKQF